VGVVRGQSSRRVRGRRPCGRGSGGGRVGSVGWWVSWSLSPVALKLLRWFSSSYSMPLAMWPVPSSRALEEFAQPGRLVLHAPGDVAFWTLLQTWAIGAVRCVGPNNNKAALGSGSGRSSSVCPAATPCAPAASTQTPHPSTLCVQVVKDHMYGSRIVDLKFHSAPGDAGGSSRRCVAGMAVLPLLLLPPPWGSLLRAVCSRSSRQCAVSWLCCGCTLAAGGAWRAWLCCLFCCCRLLGGPFCEQCAAAAAGGAR